MGWESQCIHRGFSATYFLVHLLLIFLSFHTTSLLSQETASAEEPSMADIRALAPPKASRGIYFVTFMSIRRGFYCEVLTSAIHNGITLHVYGYRSGLRPNTKVAKLRLLLNSLDDVADDQLVMFVDGYDVLFNAGEAEILQAYRKLNTSVVFGCEKECFNEILNCWKIYNISRTRYMGLNSGGVIGPAGEIRRIYLLAQTLSVTRKKKKNHPYTDQGYVGLAVHQLRNNMSVGLDCDQTVIQNLGGKAMADMCPHSLRNCLTKTQPLLFHFNGFEKMKSKPIGRMVRYFWWGNKRPPVNGTFYLHSQGRRTAGIPTTLRDFCFKYHGM